MQITGFSRRIFLSGLLATGWSPALAKMPPKDLPNCVQGGMTNGWNWSARLTGILFGRDAVEPDEATVILGLTTVSPPGSTGSSSKDMPVLIHYLPNVTMEGITSVQAFWDGEPAAAIAIAEGAIIHDAADVSMPFLRAVSEQAASTRKLPQADARSLVYELQAADGSVRRLSMPLIGLSVAFRQAMAMRRTLEKQHKAGLCLGPDDCFLTTATCTLLGLADDCFELTAARRLRDDYLRHQPGGDNLIDAYYRLAPLMAQALWASASGRRKLLWIYWSAILPCAVLVHCGMHRRAARRYAAMFARIRGEQTLGSDMSRARKKGTLH